jgi:uncharacterized protein YerC
MPHVSRNKLSPKIEKELIYALDIIFTKITKEEEIDLFLLSLLSPTERVMLAKRLAIVILLREGLPDSQIAQTLNVTRVTVSRLRYYIESRGKGYDIALNILRDEKAIQEVKTTLISLARYAARAAGGRI